MAYYLKYILRSKEPIRIADNSISTAGQTACLSHIPGSSIRGYVISEMIKQTMGFDERKTMLLSDGIAFTNAYLSVDERFLLPSPKGFYEDKTQADGEKEIQNVVINGEFNEGMKRSALGDVSTFDFEKGLSTFYSARIGSELRIQIDEKKNMFRNAFLCKGQEFAGMVVSCDLEILSLIQSILEAKNARIGNARSSGYGKCEVLKVVLDEENPYADVLPRRGIANHAYLYLISDTVMRNDNGEYCGIDIEQLQNELGVSDLRIEFCSTSIRDVRGYNRTLGIHMPSVKMYEKGSVFKLTFDGTISEEKLKRICDTGIGERRNEGCGRILLLDESYEKINKKLKGTQSAIAQYDGAKKEINDDETLNLIAKAYYRRQLERAMRRYVVENVRQKGQISDSKAMGIIPLIESNRGDFESADKILKEYYQHEYEKRTAQKIHKNIGDIRTSAERVMNILETDLGELLGMQSEKSVMGVPVGELISEEETGRLKLELILSELRYDNQEGKKNG